MKTKKFLLLLIVSTLLGISFNGKTQESQVKALYIYNFSRLVKWPDDYMKDEFVIGIFGDNDLYEYLLNFTKNKKVGSLDIKVVKYNSPSEISYCHILYIPEFRSSKIKEITNIIGNKPVLIISGKEGLLNYGSIIDFVFIDNKLKFKISEQNAQRQNLTVSKSLLDMSI